jgi:hypothetical protein
LNKLQKFIRFIKEKIDKGALIVAGNPSNECILIIGYENRGETVVYHDPSSRDGAYKRARAEDLLKKFPELRAVSRKLDIGAPTT